MSGLRAQRAVCGGKHGHGGGGVGAGDGESTLARHVSKFIRCALGGVAGDAGAGDGEAVEGGSIMGGGSILGTEDGSDTSEWGCDAGDIFGIGVRVDDLHCRIRVRLN